MTVILGRMEGDRAISYLDMLLAHGGANGDAAVAQVVQQSKIRDCGLLVRAAEMSAMSSLLVLIVNRTELSWLEKAFTSAAGSWRVRPAYEIAKAGKSAGQEWLSARYDGTLSAATDKRAAAQFLGYVMYLSILENWNLNATILLKCGADVSIKEKSTGNTLLHATAIVGDIALSEALVQRGVAAVSKELLLGAPPSILQPNAVTLRSYRCSSGVGTCGFSIAVTDQGRQQ